MPNIQRGGWKVLLRGRLQRVVIIEDLRVVISRVQKLLQRLVVVVRSGIGRRRAVAAEILQPLEELRLEGRVYRRRRLCREGKVEYTAGVERRSERRRRQTGGGGGSVLYQALRAQAERLEDGRVAVIQSSGRSAGGVGGIQEIVVVWARVLLLL